jgi:hypothetical protein
MKLFIKGVLFLTAKCLMQLSLGFLPYQWITEVHQQKHLFHPTSHPVLIVKYKNPTAKYLSTRHYGNYVCGYKRRYAEYSLFSYIQARTGLKGKAGTCPVGLLKI